MQKEQAKKFIICLYSLSLWLLHRWPHFAPNYSINPASIIPSSFTSHYLPNPNPIPVPARPESHLVLQKIYKNVDRIQISVISTFFSSSFLFIYCILATLFTLRPRFSSCAKPQSSSASSPGPESPPSAFLMVACTNLQLQLQHAQTAGFNIKMRTLLSPPPLPMLHQQLPLPLAVSVSHLAVCLPGVRAFCENKQQ